MQVASEVGNPFEPEPGAGPAMDGEISEQFVVGERAKVLAAPNLKRLCRRTRIDVRDQQGVVRCPCVQVDLERGLLSGPNGFLRASMPAKQGVIRSWDDRAIAVLAKN